MGIVRMIPVSAYEFEEISPIRQILPGCGDLAGQSSRALGQIDEIDKNSRIFGTFSQGRRLMVKDDEIAIQIEKLIRLGSHNNLNPRFRSHTIGMLQALLWVTGQEGREPIEILQDIYGPKNA